MANRPTEEELIIPTEVTEAERRAEEQRIFDARIRMAQKLLGMMCPEAERFMTLMEHGPEVLADAIYRAHTSDTAKCLYSFIQKKASALGL